MCNDAILQHQERERRYRNARMLEDAEACAQRITQLQRRLANLLIEAGDEVQSEYDPF